MELEENTNLRPTNLSFKNPKWGDIKKNLKS